MMTPPDMSLILHDRTSRALLAGSGASVEKVTGAPVTGSNITFDIGAAMCPAV